jgi:hypothetical protein
MNIMNKKNEVTNQFAMFSYSMRWKYYPHTSSKKTKSCGSISSDVTYHNGNNTNSPKIHINGMRYTAISAKTFNEP